MSVKKEASGSRSVKAPGSAQSSAERQSAEAELEALINKFAPQHLRLIGAMRKSLRKLLPTACEVVYEYSNQGAVVISFSPNEHGYDGVLAIRATADGVKLYFTRGKELPDPAKLLQGSSQTRFIDVEGASTLTRPAVARLIDEAIACNRVPFARAGRGSVAFRSSAAKKRRPK
jgi:hypothetical protein